MLNNGEYSRHKIYAFLTTIVLLPPHILVVNEQMFQVEVVLDSWSYEKICAFLFIDLAICYSNLAILGTCGESC